MKEWFKKYLGWVGLGVWVAFTLIEFLGRETEYFAYENFAFTGLCFIGGAQMIHGILNEKFLTKYSEKVKNGWIVFIVALTIVEFFFMIGFALIFG